MESTEQSHQAEGSTTLKVLIRTHGSESTGFGHISRTLVLAGALPNPKKVVFATEIKSGHWLSRIEDHGFEHAFVSVNESPKEQIGQIAKTNGASSFDLVVTDHYQLDPFWQHEIRSFAGQVLAIDDLANRQLDCDYLLDPNHSANEEAYRALVPDHCKLLVGGQFALLHPVFKKLREKAKIRERIRRVLIAFGGGEGPRHTLAVCQALSRADLEIQLDVVASSSKNAQELEKEFPDSAANSLQVHTNLSPAEIGALMVDADLAIAGAGQMSWERCCLGLPSLVAVTAPNQRKNASVIEASGAGELFPMDWQQSGDGNEILDPLRDLLESRECVRSMSESAFSLVDGRGVDRVLGQIVPLHIRGARSEDARCLWEWANDPLTRNWSLSREPIPWDTHVSWFEKCLSSSYRQLFIAEWCGNAVGSCRFDETGGESVVSISLAPTMRGIGLGVPLLSTSIRHFLKRNHESDLIAFIREGNHASKKIFERCGFIESENDVEGVWRYVFSQK